MYGAPVAAANKSCIPEILGEAAIYFDPSDINDMAAAIRKIMTNKKLRAELIAKGQMQISKYSWRRMAEQVHDVYLSASNPKSQKTD